MEFSNSGVISLKTSELRTHHKKRDPARTFLFQVLTRRFVRPVLYDDDVPLSAARVLTGAERAWGGRGRGGGGDERTTE